MFYVSRSRLLLAATLLGTVLPLWTVRYIPGTDLPSHLAIANILAKLVAHDPVVSRFYAINLQPVPYYAVYLALAPLVAWFGPFLAAKIFCSVVAVAVVLTAHRLFRVLRAPWWASATAVFLYYGMIFFWGFLPTLIGVPLFIYGVSELFIIARAPSRKSVIAASCVGILLMVTHIALLVPWACALVAMWFTGERRTVRSSLTIGVVSLLPLLPFACLRLAGHHEAHPFSVQYDDGGTALRLLMSQFGVFDRGFGSTTHIAFLAFAGVFALLRSRGGLIARPVVHMASAFAALSVIAYVATPMAMNAGGDAIWAFNVRLFFAAELAVVVWLTVDREQDALSHEVVQPLLVFAHLATLLVFFQTYNAHTSASEPVLAALPEGATLAVAAKEGRFHGSWPPLSTHVHGYYLATHSGYDGAVFNGQHIPITAIAPLCNGNMTDPRATGCTYLFAQGAAVAAALEICKPVVVSGDFALLRDCVDRGAIISDPSVVAAEVVR